MLVNEAECEFAGLDLKEVSRIALGINRYAKQAKKLGICIYGGTGCGELRYRDNPQKGGLKIAFLDGIFDGGDGSEYDWGDGLLRGE